MEQNEILEMIEDWSDTIMVQQEDGSFIEVNTNNYIEGGF